MQLEQKILIHFTLYQGDTRMALKITTTNITDIRIGTTAVDKVYAGTNLVWQRASEYVAFIRRDKYLNHAAS